MSKRKSNKKIILIIALVIIIIAIIVKIVVDKSSTEAGKTNKEENYVETSDNGVKKNISSKLNEDKKLDGLDITNIELKSDGHLTKLTAIVKNNTKQTKGGYPAEVIFLDNENNEITKMGVYIKELKEGESTTLNGSITFDYTNAYNINIQK